MHSTTKHAFVVFKKISACHASNATVSMQWRVQISTETFEPLQNTLRRLMSKIPLKVLYTLFLNSTYLVGYVLSHFVPFHPHHEELFAYTCVGSVPFQLVVDWTLVRGVRRQMEAFKDGFNSVFPLSNLLGFYPAEVTPPASSVLTRIMQ